MHDELGRRGARRLTNADGSEMEIGDTEGGRTGKGGGVTCKVSDKSTITKNDDGTLTIYWVLEFHIPTSKGDLIIESNSMTNAELESKGLNINKVIEDTVEAFNMILKADGEFFDSMYGTNPIISFQSGLSIQKYYNDHRSKEQPEAKGMVAGLRTGTRSNPTIMIALELYLEGGHPDLFSNTARGRYNLTVWEVVAHEFTHQKHFLAIPDYWSYDHYGRENMVIDFVNSFRSIHNNFWKTNYRPEYKIWK